MIYGGTRGFVFCIDEKSGQELWRTKLATGGLFNAASYGDVAVLVREQTIVAGCNGHVWGLDRRSGDVLWHNPLSGLGNNFVALADDKTSIQLIHKVTSSGTGSGS